MCVEMGGVRNERRLSRARDRSRKPRRNRAKWIEAIDFLSHQTARSFDTFPYASSVGKPESTSPCHAGSVCGFRRHRLKRLLDNFRLRRIRKCVSAIIWEVSLKRTTNVRKCFSEPPSLFRKSRKRDCFQVPSSAARTPARAGRGPAALFFRGRRPRRTMRSTEVAHGAGDAQGTSRTAVPDSPSRILVFRRHPRDGPIHRSRRDSLTAPPYPRPF